MEGTIDLPAGDVALRRLFVVRAIGLAGYVGVIAVVQWGFGIPLPVLPLAIVLALVVMLEVATGFLLCERHRVSDNGLLVQILADVAALSWLLFFSGGSTNPFVSLYLLPIVFASVTLSVGSAWLVTAVCAIAYSVQLKWYVPIAIPSDGGNRAFNLHVIGMWFNFLASAGLLAFFVSRMSEAVRGRDRALAEAREDALRDERIVALGTLAAGAAHELSTPLSTLAVVAHETAQEHRADPGLSQAMGVIEDQVGAMKRILTRLTAQAGRGRLEGGQPVPAYRFVAELIETWKLMRPDAVVAVEMPNTRPAPVLLVSDALVQALIVLFNNAADVSPRDVRVDAAWDDAHLIVSVRDRGPGFEAGDTVRGKQGMGVGLLIAHSTVERLGGQVRMVDRVDGGALVEVRLPIVRP